VQIKNLTIYKKKLILSIFLIFFLMDVVENNTLKPQQQKLKHSRNGSHEGNEEPNLDDNNQIYKFSGQTNNFNYEKFQMAKSICKCELCEMENVFMYLSLKKIIWICL
jgi:hypothetical protein